MPGEEKSFYASVISLETDLRVMDLRVGRRQCSQARLFLWLYPLSTTQHHHLPTPSTNHTTMPRPTSLASVLATIPPTSPYKLIQPLSWSTRFPDSYWVVTRTKLRFKPFLPTIKSEAGEGKDDKKSITGKGKGKEEKKPAGAGEKEEVVDLLRDEKARLKAFGKAWGYLVWNGKSVLTPFPSLPSPPLHP